jgi:two-component system chemotaxis response regulator CheY
VNKTALIVDDSGVMRQVVAYTLREAGYQVTEAADGKQAVGCLDAGSYNLIITDLNMPEMDGVTFITHARKHPQNRFAPILMLTTESGAEQRQRGKDAGATAWLVKPFDPDKLLAVISKVVR